MGGGSAWQEMVVTVVVLRAINIASICHNHTTDEFHLLDLRCTDLKVF